MRIADFPKLRIARVVLSIIILLNILEQLTYFEDYHLEGVLADFGKVLLCFSGLVAFAFMFSKKRFWGLLLYLCMLPLWLNNSWIKNGVEAMAPPILLFFSFYNFERESSKEQKLLLYLLQLQWVVVYTYAALSKLFFSTFWVNGEVIKMFFPWFEGFIPLNVVSCGVIFYQLSAFLLFFVPFRKIMLIGFAIIHLMILMVFKLYVFQGLCLIYLLCLWDLPHLKFRKRTSCELQFS